MNIIWDFENKSESDYQIQNETKQALAKKFELFLEFMEGGGQFTPCLFLTSLLVGSDFIFILN